MEVLTLSATLDDRDAIAVIAISCRFAPDLTTPAKLWSFLINEGSAVSEMPDKRWEPYTAGAPEATGIMRETTRKGSFLDDIEGFDAEFFQISPREAEFLDPQQRIFLELVWEALGDAGVPPLSLGGTEAGVFVSANSNDYGRRLLEDVPRTGAWAVNGTTFYGIANRVSYFLDLRGPSMAVDTACAGSLTALHVACQALRAGETPLAIAGGINIMASPALVVALDAAGATAEDGRSKAFDAGANGYGRGEGAGVMVLKRLSDAVRDGDPVRAVIRASGVFQDGRSNGMMAPNGAAQEDMLRRIYRRSGVDPRTVDYVEAHGTGTPLGDLAETEAIANVFGAHRDADDPLLFGTLKPNIGHVEAASGIAGAIKVLLAMEHGTIPASPHEDVNPTLELERSGLRLVAEATKWPQREGPRRAGVSSYGVGGTIAHMIIERPQEIGATPVPEKPVKAADRLRVFALSAASDPGLQGLAGAVADWLRTEPGASLEAIAHTLALRRSHLTARAAIVARSRRDLNERLEALAAGGRSPHIAIGRAASTIPGAVWVFSGHGAQWTGMGRGLLRDDPAFAKVIDELAEVFGEELGWTPRELIDAGGPWTTTRVQAMTFAMQVALAAAWRARGARPAAVIGHSVGEIAASVVAGALDVEDGARFACRRAKALEAIAGRGAMAMVSLPFDDVHERLAGRDDVVAGIAASSTSTVISGDIDAVEQLVDELRAEELDVRRVKTEVAFHSPHLDEVLPEVAAAAKQMTARAPEVPLYSSALADPRSEDPREGVYWETNLRSPVRFAHAVQAAIDDGARVFLEVSSHPVVTHSVNETMLAADVDGVTVATLRREKPELETMLTGLAELHCAGVEIDWTYDGELLPIPSVQWQHRPYWIFPDRPAETGGRGHDPDAHTLLGGLSTVATSPAQRVWQTHLDMSNRPYAQDHKVVGVETVPASVVINSFVAAASRDGEVPGVSDIILRTPLAATPPRVVQVVLDQNRIRVASRIRRDESGSESPGHDLEWITHATATVDRSLVAGAHDMEEVEAIRSRCPEEWTWARVDAIFRNMGVEGYTFPWVVEELRRNDGEQLAIVTIDHTPKLHPSSWTAVIDGALTVSGVLITKENSTTLRTSSHLESIVFRGDPPPRIVVHTTRSASSPETSIDVLVADMDGNVVCEATGLRFTEVQDRPGAVLAPRQLVHETTWEATSPADGANAIEEALLVGDASVTAPLAERLGARDVACRTFADVDELPGLSEPAPGVLVVAPEPQREGETPEQAAQRCALMLLGAAQHLSGEQAASDASSFPVKLWCVTRGVRAARDEAALSHASLWGVSRIIAGERPDLWGGVVDVDDGPVDAGTDVLVELLGGLDPSEDIVSVTDEGAFAMRLAQIERAAEGDEFACRPDGTYLITGGLGGVGLEVARYLVDRGARRLLLLGRRGLPPRVEWDAVQDAAVRTRIEAVMRLEALGATVRVLPLDICDEEAVRAALAPETLDLPPIRGVVHAAGVVSDALVDKTDSEGLLRTMGAKARGAMVLHRLFAPGTLDFFTMFSSCGQIARLTGQASYAAANSFLDGLAALRHAGGHTETVSLAWAQWRGVGMGESTAGTTIIEAEARGLGGISAAEAFRAWAFTHHFAEPYYAILRVLPERSLPVFSALTAIAEAGGPDAGGADLVAWDELDAEELAARVLDEVHEQVAAELSLDRASIDIDQALIELGVDSVLTVGLRVRLNRRFGIDLPPTVLWSNPTIRALAEFLSAELRPDGDGDGEPARDRAMEGVPDAEQDAPEERQPIA